MDEFLKVYDHVSKIGFPAFFIYGLLRGWWTIRPHVDLLVARIAELTADVDAGRATAGRATDLAEASNRLAAEAAALARDNKERLELLLRLRTGER